MALPWPHGAPTLPRPLPAVSPAAPGSERTEATRRELPHSLARVRDLALSPVTALVAMLLGLALLFVLPYVGLPFVAVVVLPTVVYHLQTEHRIRLRRTRR